MSLLLEPSVVPSSTDGGLEKPNLFNEASKLYLHVASVQ